MFTKTTISAIRALLIIGREAQQEPISLSTLASTIEGSPSYLSKILGTLTKYGLLISERGIHGGVRLALPPEQITLLQIVEAIQGPILADYCQDVGDLNIDTCSFHKAMKELHEMLTGSLRSWTLAKLLTQPCAINPDGIPISCRMEYRLPTRTPRTPEPTS